jgi:hypothetical protein
MPGGSIASCNSTEWVIKLVKVLAPGTENDDLNPARVRPLNLFDVCVGADNLFHTEHKRWALRLTALNITNKVAMYKVAMYNFLSTCSGTHFVAPRAYRAELGIAS